MLKDLVLPVSVIGTGSLWAGISASPTMAAIAGVFGVAVLGADRLVRHTNGKAVSGAPLPMQSSAKDVIRRVIDEAGAIAIGDSATIILGVDDVGAFTKAAVELENDENYKVERIALDGLLPEYFDLRVTNLGPRIHPLASIGRNARLGKNVRVGANARIEDWSEIGEGTVIEADAHVDRSARIGSRCLIKAGCWVQYGCKLGNEVTVGVNATVGSFAKLSNKVVIRDGATVPALAERRS